MARCVKHAYHRASVRKGKALCDWERSNIQKLLEKYTPKDSQLLINIKSLSSFIRKTKRKPVQAVHDVLRAAILTQNQKEATQVANEMKRTLPLVEFDRKSDPEAIESGYYGSYHLKLWVDRMICEVYQLFRFCQLSQQQSFWM